MCAALNWINRTCSSKVQMTPETQACLWNKFVLRRRNWPRELKKKGDNQNNGQPPVFSKCFRVSKSPASFPVDRPLWSAESHTAKVLRTELDFQALTSKPIFLSKYFLRGFCLNTCGVIWKSKAEISPVGITHSLRASIFRQKSARTKNQRLLSSFKGSNS